MAELMFELHSPLTEEDWDLITDVDLDHTPSVIFHTKHGKDVEYVKVKHGRWIKITQEWADYAEYFCSCCGRKIKAPFTLNPAWAFPYCHCGAKMDEVTE